MLRTTAYEILTAVMLDRQYANLLLRKKLSHLSPKDKALVTQIVYGTLQHYRYIRYQYTGFLNNKLDARNKILIDMSVYQLFWLDKIPTYAIINEAVEISKTIKQGQYHQMVNGILRNIERQGKLSAPDFATEHSFEPWLLTMIAKQYSQPLMEQFAIASNQPSKVVLRVNTLKTTPEALLADEKFTPAQTSGALLYDGNIINTDYYTNGLVSIQDGGSQQVAPFTQVLPGQKVLDICAAPGSKTAHMADLMHNQGAIHAVELHPHRLELLKETMRRLGVTIVHPLCGDALQLTTWYQPHSFDIVVADVPCSGLGVLKRKPEIKHFITPQALDELVVLQAQLLEAAATMVKPGGKLVYSTCTINKKENSGQIVLFLKNHPEFTLDEERLIWPDNQENDGFYLARLVKT